MKKLNSFIESQKQFDQCAMKHAVPVTICQECVQPYVSVVQTFHDLSTTVDPNSVRHKCIDNFINHNKLNIVWGQYQNSRILWNEAACTSKQKQKKNHQHLNTHVILINISFLILFFVFNRLFY